MRLVAGSADLEPWDLEYNPQGRSRFVQAAQCVFFGAVMADAAMLNNVIELDFWGREAGVGGAVSGL